MKAMIYASIVSVSCLLFSCGNSNEKLYFGDADAIGSDEDAFERMHYDWAMLHDPATGKMPDHMRARELAFAATLPHLSNSGLNKTTAATWQARGPWNVGGRTRAFAIDVSNENNLIAGTTSGGMWRSIDGGGTWSMTTPINSYQGATCLAQDTRAGHASTWYFGTGEIYGSSASAEGAAYSGNGIYKSTDGGASWSVLSSTTSPLTTFTTWSDYIWNIVTDRSNSSNDVVYAAAYGGIYTSTDGGTNWTLVKGSFGTATDATFTDIAITSTGVLYVTLSSNSGHKGIFRSIDGVNFTDITPASFPLAYQRIKVTVSPADESQVFFLGNTPGYGQKHVDFNGTTEWNSLWKYKYLSGDGSGTGGVWDDRSLNLPSTGGPFDKYQCQGSYDIVIKVKPNDTNAVFIGGTNLFRSTTAFADTSHTTFIGGYLKGTSLPIVQQYPNQHPDQHELVFLPSDANKMISANDGGMYKTTDNTASSITWTSLNNGYLTTMFYTCAIDHATNSDIVVAGAQDNGSWYTNNANLTTPWVTPRGGDGSYCYIADNEDAYYLSIQNGKMMKAKLDANGAVTSFARIDPIGASGYEFINPYTIDPNNNNIMYLAGGAYLWRNDNLGGIPFAGNWDSISTNWTKLQRNTNQVTSIGVSKIPANRVYYGTANRTVYRVDNANVGNPIATLLPSLGFPSGGYASCVAVDPRNADNVMVVFSNYNVYSLFYSTDGGNTWTKIAGNLEENPDGTGNGPSIRWARIIPVNDGTVYMLGTSVGLFATTQLNAEGTYWTQQATSEIGNSVVTMIDSRSTDGLVVVATHSHGVFSTHITSVNDVVGIKHINQQNGTVQMNIYPNPVKDVATIKINLKKKSNITILLTDAMGRYVKTIASAITDAGDKEYILPTEGLSSGIYYCTLKTDAYIETKKIVVTK
jgi:hypothetical protein